jgi:NitT/TauT family transport system substrate-binding protein
MRRIFQRAAAGALAFVVVLTIAVAPRPAAAAEMLLTEPVHGVSFLPVYVALRKGYFKDEGIDLKITSMSGTNFVSAVLTGDAFAFLGSVDHNAFAKANGKDLKAVSNLVARANIYFLARKDLTVTDPLQNFLKGKRIAVSPYGRTPNNVLRFFLARWGLEPGKDVTLIEVDPPVIPNAVAAKQADIGVSQEPFISKAYTQGIWGQPFFNAGKELGPYPDTAVSVRGDSIEKNPQLVKSLVKAVIRGLVYTNAHANEMLEFAKSEFPTTSPDDLKASLERAFADGIYSTNGFIPTEAWKTGEAIVRQGGILKQDVGYNEVVDMRFAIEIDKELGLK